MLNVLIFFQLKNPCPDYVKECVQTAIKLHKEEPPGDVLIFLTGKLLCEYIDELILNIFHCHFRNG